MVRDAEVEAIKKKKQAIKNNETIKKKNKIEKSNSAKKTAATDEDIQKRILPYKSTMSGPE